MGRDFSNWIKDRIAEYGFVEGEDYSLNLANRSDGLPGRGRNDYQLSLDMAKELGMVERTEQGRKIRRYFIACEARKLTRPAARQLALPAPTLHPDVQAAINDRAWALAGDALAEIKPWLTAEVRKGALNPDGTPAPNFANTLAHADFAAFTTQYASARIETGLRLLTFIHNETGAIITALAAKQAELKGKP